MCSMCLFSHRLRFEVVWISVHQYQSRNLAHEQVRKRAYVVAAKGGAHQNVGSANRKTISPWRTRPRFANGGAGAAATRALEALLLGVSAHGVFHHRPPHGRGAVPTPGDRVNLRASIARFRCSAFRCA